MLKKFVGCMRSNRSNFMTLHRRKLKNHARFMISNECPPNLGPTANFQLNPFINYNPTETTKMGRKCWKNQNVWDQIDRISWQCIDENWKIMQGFMISNEYSSIWDQPRTSSSIRLEMTIQLRPPQRWEEIAEKKTDCMRSNKSNILTMHRWKLKNHARFMISNEYPPIWDQPRISSSIRLEMTIQLRPQRWEENAEKITRIYIYMRPNRCIMRIPSHCITFPFPSLRGGLRPYVWDQIDALCALHLTSGWKSNGTREKWWHYQVGRKSHKGASEAAEWAP